MKKIGLLLCLVLCLGFAGCGNVSSGLFSNAFAKSEYNSDEKIAEEADRYAKHNSVFNPIEGGYSLEVQEFDGRQTLWSDNQDEESVCEMDFSFSLSAGQAKVVHIDKDGNVTTVIECTPETITDGFVTKAVALKTGKNRLKIVGYDCKNLDLKVIFKDDSEE